MGVGSGWRGGQEMIVRAGREDEGVLEGRAFESGKEDGEVD